MATWADLKGFVKANYKVDEINDLLLKLVFDTGNLRTQMAYVEFAGNDSGAAWVKMTSPIGRVEEVDLRSAAEKLGTMIFGGLAISGEWVYVTNGMPLQDIDANEITEPLARIVGIADALEGELLGKDAV